MSARDKIHARLYKGPNENRDDLIDELLREYAHELAEKIRGTMEYDGFGARKTAQISENVGKLAAADLIDPEAYK